MKLRKFVATLLALVFISPIFAGTISPKRTIEEIDHERVKAEKTEVVKLKNAHVAIADYALIKKDFPQLSSKSNDEIDTWLLNQVGYISKSQYDNGEKEKVNTKIEIEDSKRPESSVYRPVDHGRALVYNAYDPSGSGEQIGIIDAKGVGAKNPKKASHKNGLATLGECLREFAFTNLVNMVTDHAGIKNGVVGSYAVIYPGFDMQYDDEGKNTTPAGIFVRQGHKRDIMVRDLQSTLASVKQKQDKPRGPRRETGRLEVEPVNSYIKLLNTYGIEPFGNVQGTSDNDLFDFGHYVIQDSIKEKDQKIWHDRFLKPTSDKSVELIDHSKSIDFGRWGYNKDEAKRRKDESEAKAKKHGKLSNDSRFEISVIDNAYRWSHNTADAYVKDGLRRDYIEKFMDSMLRPVAEKLKSHLPASKENIELAISFGFLPKDKEKREEVIKQWNENGIMEFECSMPTLAGHESVKKVEACAQDFSGIFKFFNKDKQQK